MSKLINVSQNGLRSHAILYLMWSSMLKFDPMLPPWCCIRSDYLLDLDPPTPAGALGDQTFPSTPITSHSVNTTPADSHLL